MNNGTTISDTDMIYRIAKEIIDAEWRDRDVAYVLKLPDGVDPEKPDSGIFGSRTYHDYKDMIIAYPEAFAVFGIKVAKEGGIIRDGKMVRWESK